MWASSVRVGVGSQGQALLSRVSWNKEGGDSLGWGSSLSEEVWEAACLPQEGAWVTDTLAENYRHQRALAHLSQRRPRTLELGAQREARETQGLS